MLRVLAGGDPTSSSPVTIISLVVSGLFALAGGFATIWGALKGKREDNTAMRMNKFDERVDGDLARRAKRIEELEDEVAQVKTERDRGLEDIARMRRYMIDNRVDPDGWTDGRRDISDGGR